MCVVLSVTQSVRLVCLLLSDRYPDGAAQKVCYARPQQEAQLMLTNPRDAFSGQSRSPNIVPFHRLGIVSSCAIVTLSLRGAVFTIFDFKKCRDLEIGQRSLKVIESGTIRKIFYSFLLVSFSKVVPKTPFLRYSPSKLP